MADPIDLPTLSWSSQGGSISIPSIDALGPCVALSGSREAHLFGIILSARPPAIALTLLCGAWCSTADAQGLGSTSRPQPIDTLRVVPRLEPTILGSPPAARPAPPSDAPILAIPGTNGRAALGVEAPPAHAPGNRIIIAPGTIATPPRSVRGQSGTVPSLSITIPSR